MKLIVGLGNPGERYNKTRHNLGFLLLEEYAKKKMGPKIIWELDKKLNSEILKLDKNLWLVKPQTFMNNSGQAVKALVDLDLILGKIKLRQGGGTSGHKGVESILKALGSEQFIRLRLGIGNEKSHLGEHKRITFNAAKFVLEPFMPNERSKIKHITKGAIGAMDLLLEKGLEAVQNQYN